MSLQLLLLYSVRMHIINEYCMNHFGPWRIEPPALPFIYCTVLTLSKYLLITYGTHDYPGPRRRLLDLLIPSQPPGLTTSNDPGSQTVFLRQEVSRKRFCFSKLIGTRDGHPGFKISGRFIWCRVYVCILYCFCSWVVQWSAQPRLYS